MKLSQKKWYPDNSSRDDSLSYNSSRKKFFALGQFFERQFFEDKIVYKQYIQHFPLPKDSPHFFYLVPLSTLTKTQTNKSPKNVHKIRNKIGFAQEFVQAY